MLWTLSHRADARARKLADRHYNRQSIGATHFTPPGRSLVLLDEKASALWVTSWPFAQYVKHEWAGAWICSCFRNEGCERASDLIRDAVSVTRWHYGEPPQVQSEIGTVGFVSFIDREKVRPTMVRGSPVWGWTWLKAGWEVIGKTKGGLLAIGLREENMPQPEPYLGTLFSHLYD